MQIQASGRAGFTLVEIMIVVAIIGLLAAIAIPNFIRAKETSQRTTCMLNLKGLAGVKAIWALENKRTSTDTPTDEEIFGPSLYMSTKPACPTSGTYSLNQVDTKPTCTVPTHTL